MIIENKIGAGEHGDQLDRYYKAVREQYPDYRLLALYLTPGSDEPSHPEYLPVDYRTVCEILDDLAESRASVTEPDLRVLITHYTEMLRRHIVGDSEIATLSQQIYRKHKRAIDLIIQHQPSASNHIREVILGLVDSEPRLIVDREAGENVRFAVSDWDTAATLSGTTNWSSSKRILLFEVHNKPPDVRLILFIGPGRDKTRNRLFELAKHTGSPFQVPRAIGKEINRIYSRPLIESETLDEDKSEEEIRENWADFLENDLPRIDAALKQEHWIWDMSDTGESEETPSKSERFGWSDEDIETQRPDRDPDQSGY